MKLDLTETNRKLNRPEVGRKARRDGTVETPALTFPEFGSLKDTQPWGKITRDHAALIKGRHVSDLCKLADTFRNWCAEKLSPFHISYIEKNINTWCKSYSPR